MEKINSKHSYEDLFKTEKDKADAFDRIASVYYMCNFGSISKSDFEVLMFSLYIDKILEKNEENYSLYSDYTLSKVLGITQNRVSSLKIKKELKYPYKDFDWRKSFSRILKKARLDNGKIRMYIPDTNLYIEIKNIIEQKGDYVDVTLNPKVLSISPASFLDLLVEVAANKADVKELKKQIKEKLDEQTDGIDFFSEESFSQQLKQNGIQLGMDVFSEVLNLNPVAKILGSAVEPLLKMVSTTFRDKKVMEKFKQSQ